MPSLKKQSRCNLAAKKWWNSTTGILVENNIQFTLKINGLFQMHFLFGAPIFKGCRPLRTGGCMVSQRLIFQSHLRLKTHQKRMFGQPHNAPAYHSTRNYIFLNYIVTKLIPCWWPSHVQPYIESIWTILSKKRDMYLQKMGALTPHCFFHMFIILQVWWLSKERR